MQTRLLRSIAVIVAVGILLGIGWAIRESQNLPREITTDGSETPAPTEAHPAFGQYFTFFFLGRSGDGRRIGKNTPLIRSTKFLAGERAGIRAQTASDVRNPIGIELRFLTHGTREEPDALKALRQQFTIRPGIFSYCCVRIPKVPGQYDVGIVIGEVFVGSIPITVKPAPTPGTGGLF